MQTPTLHSIIKEGDRKGRWIISVGEEWNHNDWELEKIMEDRRLLANMEGRKQLLPEAPDIRLSIYG